MYPFPVGLALVDMLTEHHEGRLEHAARLAREGRGELEESRRRPFPRRRSRLVWLFGPRRGAVA